VPGDSLTGIDAVGYAVSFQSPRRQIHTIRSAEFSLVPEPAALVMLLTGLPLILRRRAS